MAIPKSSLKKRNGIYYLHYIENGVRKRLSLHTNSLRFAQDKQRQFDSARVRGEDTTLATRTPLAEIVSAYIQHMQTRFTKNGFVSDLSVLRKMFGPICPELKHGHRSPKALRISIDERLRDPVITTKYLEQITTAQISEFILERVRRHDLQPKTANRYRELLQRLFNWAMQERGVRMPGGLNPATKVKRYVEHPPQIRFLTKPQIEEQMKSLDNHPMLRTMVAIYIYAGLRREEVLWLTVADIDLNAGIRGVIRIHSKTVNGEFWEPKTKVNRVVPISKALRGYIDLYEAHKVPGDWFFSTRTGHRWHPDNFSQYLRAINEEAGLKWGCLDFRHTFGSHLAMKGESLYKIATLMGNSPEICRRHYACLLPESLLQSVEFDDNEPLNEIPSPGRTGRPYLRLIVNKEQG